MRRRRGEKVLPPVHPNVGLEAIYRRKLVAMIEAMQKSVVYWLTARYRANPPRLAQDATPAAELRAAIREMATRWEDRFDEAAPKLADWFARDAEDRSTKTLMSILRRGGFTVKFKMTAAMRDVLQATTGANVALIKSIPSQYFTEIEGLVMRSVQTGRDLGTLTKELQARYGITWRRAAFIAKDQNDKATSAVTRTRQTELGIDEAIWHHSGGGKEPRPTHVANSGKRYKVSQGWYDPAVKRYIWPGTEPGCRCISRSVVKGFS